jgi:hypothetical protein
MFGRSISRRGWLVLIAVAGGALLAAGRGQTPAQNYYPGFNDSSYGQPPYVQSPYGQAMYRPTAAQVLARGAQERAFAAAIAGHAMDRMDATLSQAQQFDQNVIVGR